MSRDLPRLQTLFLRYISGLSTWHYVFVSLSVFFQSINCLSFKYEKFNYSVRLSETEKVDNRVHKRNDGEIYLNFV